MKRLFLLLAVAVLVVAVGEGAVRALSPRIGPPSGWPTLEMDIKSEQLKPLDAVEVLFLGSSSMSEGIDPSVVVANSALVNLRTYNAALPFGSLEVQRFWSEAVISDKLSVDTLVLEVSPSVMLYRSKDSVAIDLRLSKPYRQLTKSSPGLLDRSRLVTYASKLRDPVAVARWLIEGPPRIALTDGQTPVCRPFQVSKEYRDLMAQDFSASELDSGFDAQDDLRLLVNEVQAKRIVFLIFPVAEEFYQIDPRLRPEWERELAQVLEFSRNQGIAVIDGLSIPWRQEFFSDPLHLNPAGAERLSEFVAGALDSIKTGNPSTFADRTYDVEDCGER